MIVGSCSSAGDAQCSSTQEEEGWSEGFHVCSNLLWRNNFAVAAPELLILRVLYFHTLHYAASECIAVQPNPHRNVDDNVKKQLDNSIGLYKTWTLDSGLDYGYVILRNNAAQLQIDIK